MTTHRMQVGQFGRYLLERQWVAADQMQIALAEQRRTGLLIGQQLLLLGFLSEQQLDTALAEQHVNAMPAPEHFVADDIAIGLVPEAVARQYGFYPIAWEPIEAALLIGLVDPNQPMLLDRLRWLVPQARRVEARLISESRLALRLDACYPRELGIEALLDQIDALADQAQTGHGRVGSLVQAFIEDAARQSASDIHFEPELAFVRVRYRVDGVMRAVRVVHERFWSMMLVRLKGLAGMDIAENRAAQDGRFSVDCGHRQLDIRAACMPTVTGENLVLRILERNRGLLALDQLGLPPKALKGLLQLIQRPAGLILMTGPTGSGKTTTLYSILAHLKSERVNIMTLEDPVEYKLDGVRQSSMGEGSRLDFDEGVRALLRQDPDIILIGEIRDAQTAAVALRAAMTGHLVFATLHANSSLGAVPRLLDLGVSPALLAENLLGVIAQRLVRKLCVACREPVAADAILARIVESAPESPVYRAVGCPRCGDSGYRGRLAVMEQLFVVPELAALLLQPAKRMQALDMARQLGFQPLQEQLINQVLSGQTDTAEACRVADFSAQFLR